MTPELWIAIITAVGIVAAAWFSAKSARQSQRTHESVNSRMDEMMVLVKKVAHAEGVKEESDRRDRLGK